MKHILLIKSLKVLRSPTFALDIHSIELQPGTVTCIVGPNGSGKTTLIECLTGLLRPTHGEIVVAGEKVNKNLASTRRIIGFVPDDEEWFIKELCAAEYFKLLKSVYIKAGIFTNIDVRINQLVHQLNFTALKQPLRTLSHGNKKKVQIIAGLMHEPQIIILDELRNGLDPLAIIAAENILRQEAKRGACIVAATHDLWWAERLADEIVLLLNGNVAIHQKTSNITRKYGSLEKLFIQTALGRESNDATV